MRLIYITILMVFSNVSLAQTSVKKTPVQIVNMDFKIALNITDMCVYGSTPAGTAMMGCSFSLGTALPDSYKIIKEEFVEDAYFDVEVSIKQNGVISFTFTDYNDFRIDDAEAFYNEVKAYYDKNPIVYEFTYEGPDLEISEDLGEPVSYME